MPRVITLLTDFGTADGYVGEMKGVLLTRVPDACIVDITHDVPAQDVEMGRLALARVWRRFPAGTVHLAIVDPGVGSSRQALAVESDSRFLVGPDNGLLSPALLAAGARVVSLPTPSGAAPTFHGRDVFAPAAAALALGTPLDNLGPVVHDVLVRRTPEPRRRDDGVVVGEVIAVDRFGNAITNLVGRRPSTLEVSGTLLPVRRTYSEVERGSPLALIGSTGLIEVAVRDGSAAQLLGVVRGSVVLLRGA
jgi:S-adenosyl-L-methionine hydrolase (adenosine-forming)